jgi:hypothetical protein
LPTSRGQAGIQEGGTIERNATCNDRIVTVCIPISNHRRGGSAIDCACRRHQCCQFIRNENFGGFSFYGQLDKVSWSDTPAFHNTLVVGSSPTSSSTPLRFLEISRLEWKRPASVLSANTEKRYHPAI